MNRGPILAAVLGGLCITACHSSTGPTGELTGHWKGTPTVYSPMDFTITQTDTLLQGSGSVNATVSQPMLVVGFVSSIYDPPIALSFAVENVAPAYFLGGLTPDKKAIQGRFTRSGASDTVTFLRQ